MKVLPLALTALLLTPAVQAQGLFKPAEVSDRDLAEIRGKFVMPDRIVHFGVTMTTLWTAGNGQQLGATVSLNMQQNLQPVLSVQFIDQAGQGALPAAQGQVIGGNQLNSVQGIAQSVRIAGSSNAGLNDLDLSISQQASAVNNPGLTLNSAPQTVSNDLGSITVSADQGLRIALNGAQGSSWQSLGNGGLNQGIAIAGQLNHVENLTRLNVALQNNSLSPASQQAWQAMQTLRPVGY